jgi:hypothetical protein
LPPLAIPRPQQPNRNSGRDRSLRLNFPPSRPATGIGMHPEGGGHPKVRVQCPFSHLIVLL